MLALLAPGAAAALDLLYLAANEGGSSGGHVALRTGGWVFHFTHATPHIVRLRREDVETFARRYRFLDNRTIHVTRLALDESREREVRDTFTAHWLERERRLANLQALEDEARLFAAALANRRGAAETVALPGPGYFVESDAAVSPSAETEGSLASLRHALGLDHGTGFLSARLDDARTELARLPPPALDDAGSEASHALLARRWHGTAARYRDLVVRLRALEIVRDATGLRGAMLRDTGLALTDAEQDALTSLRGTLHDRAAALVDGRRPDAGYVLLVTLARLAAVDRSLRAGRWLVLDTFPDDALVVDAARVARHGAAVAAALATNRAALETARRTLIAATAPARLPEAELAAVELAANRWLEARESEKDPQSYRLAAAPFVPRRAMHHLPALPWSDAVLARAAAAAEATADPYRARVRALYGYDLVRRNCVTELLRTLADAGVAMDPGALDFIPVVADARLARRLPVRETATLPSRRDTELAALRDHEPALLVALRESNVVTARAYRRNPDDSLFLFFTDGPLALRPLLGAVNLGIGVGAAVAGLTTLPVDAGHLFSAGARGALFSLPELAFVNVRKGTYDHLPAQGLPDAVFPR